MNNDCEEEQEPQLTQVFFRTIQNLCRILG